MNWDQRELLAEWVWETRGEVEVWGASENRVTPAFQFELLGG